MGMSDHETKLDAVRGSIAHCLREPESSDDATALEYIEDGLLLIENGIIQQLGPAQDLVPQLPPELPVQDYSGKLIVPGFIDTHIHYPQIDVIASYGKQLLDWLNQYTFPVESRFHDAEYAHEVADFFLNELLRNGTTTAMVYASSHPQSVEAFFQAAQQRNLRMLGGKVLMDRHVPANLADSADSGYRDSKALIERWHGQDRLLYVITPRFAVSSTEEQLRRTGQLAAEHPDVFVQTHVAESKAEVAWVAELFPWSRSYLDVYDHYGLIRERAIYAHCLHLNDTDRQRMADSGAAIAFCPTSNLFLGSGLFDLDAARSRNIRVGLATDVGGGTSFSMLQTLAEAYKVLQLQGQSLSPFQALYLLTLSGAKALYLDDKIGNFSPGKEADFVVLDPQATPLLARRMTHAHTLAEKLFVLMMLGDDRVIAATYIQGKPSTPSREGKD